MQFAVTSVNVGTLAIIEGESAIEIIEATAIVMEGILCATRRQGHFVFHVRDAEDTETWFLVAIDRVGYTITWWDGMAPALC